jgi:hypothetical protein
MAIWMAIRRLPLHPCLAVGSGPATRSAMGCGHLEHERDQHRRRGQRDDSDSSSDSGMDCARVLEVEFSKQK